MNKRFPVCPLCSHTGPFNTHRDAIGRTLFECNSCKLIFAELSHRPDPPQELERYLQHNNSLENNEYLNYIESKLNEVIHLTSKTTIFCDYGCGPAPALEHLLSLKGISCHSYDPFFFPDSPSQPVDFVMAIESAEHFFNVYQEFSNILSLLKTKGKIAVFTSFYDFDTDFASWYYARDNTHVSFYCRETFSWMASFFNLDILISDGSRMIILQKKN